MFLKDEVEAEKKKDKDEKEKRRNAVKEEKEAEKQRKQEEIVARRKQAKKDSRMRRRSKLKADKAEKAEKVGGPDTKRRRQSAEGKPPSRKRRREVDEDRIRYQRRNHISGPRKGHEIIYHRRRRVKTMLPTVLDMQLERDHKAMVVEGRTVVLPRTPSIAQLLDDFMNAKMKAYHSKLSREKTVSSQKTADKRKPVDAVADEGASPTGTQADSQASRQADMAPAPKRTKPSDPDNSSPRAAAKDGSPSVPLSSASSSPSASPGVSDGTESNAGIYLVTVSGPISEGCELDSRTIGETQAGDIIVASEAREVDADGVAARLRLKCHLGWLSTVGAAGEMLLDQQPDDGSNELRESGPKWTLHEQQLLCRLVKDGGYGAWESKATRLGTGRTPDAVAQHYRTLQRQGRIGEKGQIVGVSEASLAAEATGEAVDASAARRRLTQEEKDKREAHSRADFARTVENSDWLRPWNRLCVGLRKYFDNSLPLFLLYPIERPQYEAACRGSQAGTTPSELYGPEHLTRLMAILPEMMAMDGGDTDSELTELEEKLYGNNGFAKWFEKRLYEFVHDASAYSAPDPDAAMKASAGECPACPPTLTFASWCSRALAMTIRWPSCSVHGAGAAAVAQRAGHRTRRQLHL